MADVPELDIEFIDSTEHPMSLGTAADCRGAGYRRYGFRGHGKRERPADQGDDMTPGLQQGTPGGSL